MIIHPELISKTVNTIFNCCPTVIKNEILDHITVMEIMQGQPFIKQGEPCLGVHIIIKGGVELSLLTNENKKKVFLFKTVNDMIGIQSTINHTPYTYSADALEDIVVGFIPKAQIEKMILTYPHAFYSIFKMVNENADEMERRSSLVMTNSAEKIVFDSIEDLKNRFGTDKDGYVNIHITAKDLASYTCMSKTNLYRVLQTLKEKNTLQHHLSRYKIEKSLT